MKMLSNEVCVLRTCFGEACEVWECMSGLICSDCFDRQMRQARLDRDDDTEQECLLRNA